MLICKCNIPEVGERRGEERENDTILYAMAKNISPII